MPEEVHFRDFPLDGVTLHAAVRSGGRKLLVALHGFPESEQSWLPAVRDLPEEWTVVVPQMRGFGRSSKPNGIESYRIDRLAQDVAGLIQAAGFKSAVLLGHDWGGVVAWHLAATCPGLVQRLMVINAPPMDLWLGSARRQPLQMLKSAYIRLFNLPSLPEKIIRLNDFRILREAISLSVIRKNRFGREALGRLLDGVRPTGALEAGLNYYRAMWRLPESARLAADAPRVACPVDVLWATGDAYFSNALAPRLARYCQMPPAITRLRRCGHWVLQEAPEAAGEWLKQGLEAAAKVSPVADWTGHS